MKRAEAKSVLVPAHHQSKWGDISIDTKDYCVHVLREATASVLTTVRSAKAKKTAEDVCAAWLQNYKQALSSVQAPTSAKRKPLFQLAEQLTNQEAKLVDTSTRLDILAETHERELREYNDESDDKQTLEENLKAVEQYYKHLHESKLHPALKKAKRATPSPDNHNHSDNNTGCKKTRSIPTDEATQAEFELGLTDEEIGKLATLAEFIGVVGSISAVLDEN